MDYMSFLSELKRRNVFKVALTYDKFVIDPNREAELLDSTSQ